MFWLFLFRFWGCGPYRKVGEVDFLIDVCSGIGGLAFIPRIPGIPGFPGSGVINYGSGPPFHTRRGSG